MGLRLKPWKCQSLSVKAGKSEEVVFSIANDRISSILHYKCHKYLGGYYTFNFTSASVADVIKGKLRDQLKHIDSLLVRSEYKVRIYCDYLLGSY